MRMTVQQQPSFRFGRGFSLGQGASARGQAGQAGQTAVSRLVLAVAILMLVFMVLSFTACGRSKGQGSQTANPADLPEGNPYRRDYDDRYEIIFPGEMFEEVDLNPEFIEANEYMDGYWNEDGTVTIVMSKARHQQFLDTYQGDIDYNIDYFIDEVDFLRRITYTPDFRKMDIYVDGDTQEADYYWIPDFFTSVFGNVQQLQGMEVWVQMSVRDAATDEVMMTMEYPEKSD